MAYENFSIAVRFGGKAIYLDEQDLPLFKSAQWAVNCGYLKKRPIGKDVFHRMVINAPAGKFVDHVNGNPLDNRRCNLRVCTHTQNQWNSRKPVNNTSGVKGVYLENRPDRSLRYIAQIKVNGRKIVLGRHMTIEGAAAAYRDAAMKYHGEFARFE